MQSRDRLQAQMSMSRLNNTYFGNHHCAYGGRSFVDTPKKKLFDLPQITWKCPPKFLLNPCWRVASGEDSEEAKTQKLREARMFDTAHPYPYDTCLSDPFDARAHLSDCQVPLIPLIPVEEKEEEATESDTTAVPENPSFKSLPQVAASPRNPENVPSDSLPPPAPNNEPAAGADVVAAAAAVMTAVMKSKEEGSLIDTELLIKLLSDPQMIQNLLDCHQDIAKMGSEDLKAKPTMNKDHRLMGEPKPAVLPNPNPDPRFENSTRKLEATAQFSGPYPPTSRASIPIPRPNPVSQNFTYGQGRGWPVSVPMPSFPSPKPHAAQVSGPYPVPSRASLPTPGPNPVVESFTYGPAGKSQTPSPSFPSPKPQVSSPHPNLPPVSVHRFPSPDTGFQLEPFSPKEPSPGPPVKPAPPVKDTNYFKDLIRKHGETQQRVDPGLLKSRELQVSSLDMQLLSTLKRDRPAHKMVPSRPSCVYFNSPKGCRNGSRCSFSHDVDAPDHAKRMKLSR